ncbi:MAG: hypothetical protein JXR10_16980 [Cyclobacteriaceae bacterium]
MRKLPLLLLLLSTNLWAQQTRDWINSLENPKFPMFNELKSENRLSDYLEFNLTNIINPTSKFLGYIGTDYRRIHVDFNSVTRSENTPNLYFVYGQTTVFKNTCDFEGTITIEQVREFKNMYFGVDNMFENEGIKAQGIAIGKYHFSENPKQQHVGTFEGIMTLWWYLDKDNNIKYYDFNSHSDRYKNNQYIGTWTEYGESDTKTCNWGEHRIPFSGDLDWGAGEFSINPKYYDKGWEEFNRN